MCHKFNTQHLALSTQTQVSYFYNLWASVIVSFLCVIFSPNAIASIKANCSPWISNDYVINSLGSTPIDACIKLMQQWTVDSAKNTCDFGTRLCPIVYTFVRYAPRSVNSCRFTTASSDPNHRPANPEYDGWGNQMYCQCSEPPYGNPSYGLTAEELTEQCGVTDGLTLTLTPAPNQKDPRPKGTEGKDGKSTLELIAKVTENGNPKAGVVVGFGVAAEPFSGGHAHGDLGSIPRPK
ncbi:MAG: hypothetical protein RL761_833, partial [Pseudomonadota bacterium]